MVQNALYYPFIHVPKNAWFTRVLLYCDKVGAIVPYDYIDDPDRLGDYMVGLVRENLVEQVIPGAHLWKVDNFRDAFLEYIDAKYGENNEPATWASVHSEKLGSLSIHMEKLDDLTDKLCERGLAKRNEENEYSPWIQIEAKVANDFMAYLASVLGQIPGEETFVPITNETKQIRPFAGDDSDQTLLRLQLRHLVLDEILPSPTQAVEPARLHDFKEEHSGKLRTFQRHIEAKISDLAANPDEAKRRIHLDDIKGEFRDNIDELVAKMSEQDGWPTLDFGSLCTIVGSSMCAWKAVIDQDWKFGLTGAALSLAPAVYNAFRHSNIPLNNRPLAYAALAQHEFI